MIPFGHTRSRVQLDHALITPDTHVTSPLLGWELSSQIVHISPKIGARFTQYTATMEPGGKSAVPAAGVERFIYVMSGSADLHLAGVHPLRVGSFAYLPPNTGHEISVGTSTTEPALLAVFERAYQPLAGEAIPQAVIKHEEDVPGEPFQGDEAAMLQTFLPIEPAFDMAVNLFTYQPGATLPQVEIHVMEHGLVMLAGSGVYRLGDSWYPVQAGDVIWMKSYCPQWFVATGKTPARYLYYKDIHRDQHQ